MPALPLYPTATAFLPTSRDLADLRHAARVCKGCDLYQAATQTVFGQGPATAKAVFIGEQPGDKEDLAGEPFVGPAGYLLKQAMAEAGLDPAQTYLTNAVKHFKWVAQGKRRIHAKPTARQVAACKPWLLAELEALHPRIVVLLGATAAQALLGSGFRVTVERGRILDVAFAPAALATVHPSSLLRIPEPAARESAYGAFVVDLRQAARHLADKA